MDIEYYTTEKGNAEVKDWIDDLVSRANAGDKLAQEMVEHYIYCVERALHGMPFSRPLREQVFELRPKNSAGQHRVTYCYWNGKMLLLSEFPKKTQTTPSQEIEKAVDRKRNWISRYGNRKKK